MRLTKEQKRILAEQLSLRSTDIVEKIAKQIKPFSSGDTLTVTYVVKFTIDELEKALVQYKIDGKPFIFR
jgi:hypothetical protein